MKTDAGRSATEEDEGEGETTSPPNGQYSPMNANEAALVCNAWLYRKGPVAGCVGRRCCYGRIDQLGVVAGRGWGDGECIAHEGDGPAIMVHADSVNSTNITTTRHCMLQNIQ